MNLFYGENSPVFQRVAWYGLIFRWYGVDKIGNIAIFETGDLPIPKAVFSDESAYRELDFFFRALPKITSVQISDVMKRLKTASGNPVDSSYCIQEASQGLFYIDELDTYVENEYMYGYYLMAIPDKKIIFNALPSKMQELLEPYRFPIIFSEIEKLDVAEYLACD